MKSMRFAGWPTRAGLSLAMLGLLGGPVHGKTDARAAREYFAQAQARAKARDFAAALRLLQKAYAADPQPKYVANQGIVYLEMGQYAEAAERFEWFLGRVDDVDDQALAESFLSKLKPQVIIVSEPPDAWVSVDRERLGRTPAILNLLAGEHLLEVEREGYKAIHQGLVVEYNKGQTLKFTLEPSPEALVSGRSLEPEPDPTPRVQAPVAPVDEGWGATEWGWLAIGVGAAAGGIAGVSGALAFAETDARDAAETRADWRAAQSSAEALATGYYVGAAVAGVALIGGVVALIAGSGDGPSGRVAPAGPGLSLRF